MCCKLIRKLKHYNYYYYYHIIKYDRGSGLIYVSSPGWHDNNDLTKYTQSLISIPLPLPSFTPCPATALYWYVDHLGVIKSFMLADIDTHYQTMVTKLLEGYKLWPTVQTTCKDYTNFYYFYLSSLKTPAMFLSTGLLMSSRATVNRVCYLRKHGKICKIFKSFCLCL